MRTTGVFTVYDYEIPYQKHGEAIPLFPFGDVHRSSPHCAIDKWEACLAWMKSKPGAYFLGTGDYDDLGSTSERPILTHSLLHESTRQTLDELAQKSIERFYKEILFMKGRLIGLVEGNHYYTFIDGTTSTQRLCAMMGCKYLGVSSFIRLHFIQCIEGTKKKRRTSKVDIWMHHGKGASRLVGGSLNTVQQMAEAAEADIYLMGHDHKKSVAFINRLRLSGANGFTVLNHRKVLIARTGSFLKGYIPGESTYIADAGLNPTDLGVIKIELTPTRKRYGETQESQFIDIHASI